VKVANASTVFRIAVLAACAAAFVAPAGTHAAAPYLSQNWSGYAAVGPAFAAVSGGWREPAADCLSSATSATGASFWVGLGGHVERSHKIEQIGTSSDCNPDGTMSTYGWYELWPAAPVDVRLSVSAGDRMWAVVTIRGDKVVFELANTTTGKTYRRTVRVAAPDTSSAEWIAEAPGESMRSQRNLPLTNFGAVVFSNASATSRHGHTGTISDPTWSSASEEMASDTGQNAGAMDRFVEQTTAVQIVPGGLTRDGRGFAVKWERRRGVQARSGHAPGNGAM
jgi:hypothetical protein